MHQDYQTIEDLLQDESFINYCRGTSEQDALRWRKYIAENPARHQLITEAKEQYQQLLTAIAGIDLEEQMKGLRRKVEGPEEAPVIPLKNVVVKRSFLSRWKYAIAIAIVILGAAGYFSKDIIGLSSSAKPQYASKPGERKTFNFPDGTQVTMNAGSEIVLDKDFGKKTREVYLKGEAFFDVEHNKDVPFIVHTNDLDVKALGTAFNVRSYEGDKKSEAVLIRGLVEVTLKKENNKKVLLHPDEKISWSVPVKPANIPKLPGKETIPSIPEPPTVQHVKKTEDGSIKEMAWVENQLAFDDETFEDIAAELSRWYGVNIQFNSTAVKQYHFTATFKKEKVEQVLDILKTTREFNYNFDGDQTITISK